MDVICYLVGPVPTKIFPWNTIGPSFLEDFALESPRVGVEGGLGVCPGGGGGG